VAKKKLKLRTPLPMMERSKRAIGIILLAILMEQVDPLPFFKSTVAWFLYAWLIFEVTKQIIHYRLETRYESVRKAEQYKRRWEVRKDRLDPMARYRMRRALIIIAGTLVFGQIINLFSERCSNALSCSLLAPSLVVESAPLIFQVVVGVAFGMFQFAAMFWYLSGVGFGKIVPPGTIEVTFDDVFGQDKAKKRLVEFVDLLENDEEVVKAGGHLPKGALMTGPPGTGKTMMAKAAANRLTMPLILIPPGAFASTFIGINFLKVYRLGRWIRQQSTRHGGVLVFIDEIDSLGNRGGVEEGESRPSEWWVGESGREFWYEPRELGCTAIPTPDHDPYNIVVNGGSSGMNMGTLEAFLSMIDGMEEPRGLSNKVLKFFGFKELPPPKTRVFYLGATNRPTAVDPALKRAGRLGVELRVDYPKFEGRLSTYKGYLAKVRHDLTEDQISWLSRNHYRGTGAEIEDVINEALLLTFRDNEREVKGNIQYHDMMTATLWKRWGESHGTFENERNVRGVAIHEAGHALTMYSLLGERRHIWFVSIEQRRGTGGMVVPAPQDDDWKQWHYEMLADVAISLASRVAEQKFLGQLTNGHGGDGPAATMKAERMITNGHYSGQIAAYRPTGFYSDDRFFDLREKVLQEAYELAEREIDKHADAVLALADKLEREHTVVGTEVHELFEAFDVPMGGAHE
jgi:ATP-dependent Zn protease